MIDIKNIFPECDSDTLLVQLITQRGFPNHCKGISKVSKALEKHKDAVDRFLIGMVDSDNFKRINDDKYLRNFSELIQDLKDNEEGVVLKKIPNKRHYLIFIHTEFEPWAWKQANLAGINALEYGFSGIEEFYKESKHNRTLGSLKFKKFVNAIVMAEPPGIKFLKEWLVVENLNVK
jgi:hypothetical protein